MSHKPVVLPDTAVALVKARKAAGLSRPEVANLFKVNAHSLYRWESGLRAIGAEDYTRLMDAYAAYSAERHRNDVPRGTPETTHQNGNGPPADRKPIAYLLRTPAIRARLNAIQGELLELNATPEQEENAMRTLRDRQRIASFVGGSVDDQYTESQVRQAIDNIADVMKSILAGPKL